MNPSIQLLHTIEILRNELNQMSKERNLTDPDIIKTSQLLDTFLVEHIKSVRK